MGLSKWPNKRVYHHGVWKGSYDSRDTAASFRLQLSPKSARMHVACNRMQMFACSTMAMGTGKTCDGGSPIRAAHSQVVCGTHGSQLVWTWNHSPAKTPWTAG